jgi:predicted transcriptional regulator|tara:strand:+ start:384 stop:539 length:156 start_codon:yes stop_codon:yes gene_type:complete
MNDEQKKLIEVRDRVQKLRQWSREETLKREVRAEKKAAQIKEGLERALNIF